VTSLTYLGHAAFLIEHEGQTIAVDPARGTPGVGDRSVGDLADARP